MRRTLICLLAAGAILVAGCGGDDDDDTGNGDDASGTVEGDGSVEGFCEQFRTYDEQFTNDPEASDEDVIDAIRSLDPPEEIQGDFETLIEGLDRLQTIDTSDPEAAAGLQEEMAQYTEASTNIQTFVDENCETDDSGSGDTSDDTGDDSGADPSDTGDDSDSDVTTGDSVEDEGSTPETTG